MKRLLLATVAVGALIAGPALAQRQEAPAGDVKGAAPPPAAIQNAPAEKVAPPGKVAPDRAVDTKRQRGSETTGQATPSGRATGDSDIKARTGSDTKAPAAADRPGANRDTKPNAQTRSGAATETRGAGAAATLSTEQKDRIRTTVLTANAPRVSNVNFSINVGTVVPRSVRIVAVPAPLIEIHPAWRGYSYFVHGDTLVIVEPRTLRIIAVIDV